MEQTNFDVQFNNKYQNVFIIQEILNDYFGESRVDVKLNDIKIKSEKYKDFTLSVPVLIHFPEVTVTNENNRSINIKDLYITFTISPLGILSGTFLMTRATLNKTEIISGYLHSHLPRLSKYQDLSEFKEPCLGSGPIRSTICSLNDKFNIDLWQLFCLELDKYVHTESLIGIPYIKLKEVNNYVLSDDISKFIYDDNFIKEYYDDHSLLKDFTTYIINNHPFNYVYTDHKYSLAISIENFRIKLSNYFIQWYNQKQITKTYMYSLNDLLKYDILQERVYKNMTFYKISGTSSTNFNHNNLICVFKETPVYFKIDKQETNTFNISYVLSKTITAYIYNQINININYHYEKGRLIL